jgi:cysteinyl-tRNA synthetase
MSKSLGNVLTVRDALAQYSADALRIFLLGTHYRKDMDLKGMDAAAKRLRAMSREARRIASGIPSDSEALIEPKTLAPFESVMNDDFDTPRAISWVEGVLRKATKERDQGRRASALVSAVSAMKILGVDLVGSS